MHPLVRAEVLEELSLIEKLIPKDVNLDLAYACFDGLGDQLRRGIVEEIAGRPANSRALAVKFPEYNIADVRHRIRSLISSSLAEALPDKSARLNPSTAKSCANYVDFLMTLSSISAIPEGAPMNLGMVFSALSDQRRRGIYELIVIRPDKVMSLANRSGESHTNVSYHVSILLESGLVRRKAGKIYPSENYLPALRMYFERLWLEAELGDAWLARRQIEAADYGI